MRNEARAIELAVSTLVARLAQEAHLLPELQRARRMFLGEGPVAPLVVGAADTAEHRFAEWFVLERESETLGAVPADVPRFADQVAELEGSTAGVFLVLSVSPHGVEARDLQDEAVYDLAVPIGSLQPGDLLVGRLFPFTSGRFTPSSAAAVFRPGKDLGEAFRRDVERLELDRRLHQIELEHLLLRRTDQTPSPTAAAPAAVTAPVVPGVPLEHLEADLDRLLQSGASKHTATSISELLAAAVRPGPAMGPLLDELAFDSVVDLDRVREVLLAIWNAHHPEGIPPLDPNDVPPPAPGERLGERLVRTLDEGLRQKRDVDEVFAQLERLAGLEPGAADDGENPFDHEAEPAADDAPDPGGDLAPLVQEFLWEHGIEQGPVASALLTWSELQANAALPRTDLELVTGTDLMRLLLHVYLGAAPTERATAVRTTFQALQQFYAWAKQTLELEVGGALQECRGALLDQLDRLASAGVLLSSPPVRGLRPGILLVEDLGPRGFGARDDDGQDHWLECAPEAAAQLRQGDLVLGALVARGTGHALGGLAVVLPHDARGLME